MAQFLREAPLEPPVGWTRVRLRLPWRIANSVIDQTRHWLNDPVRSGTWYWWADAEDSGTATLVDIYFSNPDIALEFKLRWA